jgi:hypothetical protein
VYLLEIGIRINIRKHAYTENNNFMNVAKCYVSEVVQQHAMFVPAQLQNQASTHSDLASTKIVGG